MGRIIVLYFVMTWSPAGEPRGSMYEYLRLDEKPARMVCGLEGARVGVTWRGTLDNPTHAVFPDPDDAGRHCEVAILDILADRPDGEYHLATTLVEAGGDVPSMTPHDPHTSDTFARTASGPWLPRALNPRITGEQ